MIIQEIQIGDSVVIFETGRLAQQANGAVLVRCGDSIVLTTVCCSGTVNETIDYVPLQVEYNEKYYAAGKIPGGFFKREGRPREREILVSRLIDRPMRPLFSKNFKRDIQLIPTTLSTDQIHQPDILAMNAASAAVIISDIPFDGPVGSVRVGYLNKQLVVNPTYAEIDESLIDIVVAGTEEGIMMVEGGSKEVSEDLLIEAIEFSRQYINALCQVQHTLRDSIGKEKMSLHEDESHLAYEDGMRSELEKELKKACFVRGKQARNQAIKESIEQIKEQFSEKIPEEEEHLFTQLVEKTERNIVREYILKTKSRTDARGLSEIRPIYCEIDALPRTHGSSLFTRGETQALVIATLGTAVDEQIMDDIEGDRREHFMLHYNFPPYSVGETRRLGTGRREIGHGHLAHRALAAVLPSKEDFPYTLRIVSEILESNGSSSMATVCGGTMAFMSAGVPIKKPVAGIAMGLIKEGEEIAILSDILGEEDHLGDMDFKVAGTEDGITAFQMDIKIKNVSAQIMKQALAQAREGRLYILSKIQEAISDPRQELSPYAPRIVTLKVNPDKIGLLIGPGGKNVKNICEKHGVEVNIEQDGMITIYCKEKESASSAKAAFLKLLEEPEVGKVYEGTVRRVTDFGAFFEFLPSKEGLCHISRMPQKGNKSTPHDIVELNKEYMVKIIEIDKMGRVNLSMLLDATHENQRSSYKRRPYNPKERRPRRSFRKS